MGAAASIDISREFAGLFHAGLGAVQARDLKSAADLFDRAIALDPRHAAAYCNRGTVLMELKAWDAALECFEQTIELDPDHAVALCNRGGVLKELRLLDRALASVDRAISLNPRLAAAHVSRADILRLLHRFDAALDSCNRAIDLQPGLAGAYVNRGIILREIQQWDAALASYDQAIALEMDSAEAHAGRGILLHDLGRLDAAIASFDHALALEPGLAAVHFNKAMALLACGDFDGGFREYEWRFELGMAAEATARSRAPNRWRGDASLYGKTILLHGEQGLGDTLQFCRFATLVADRGARVILEVPAPLKTLMASVRGVSEVRAPGEAGPACDYQCSLLSLPHALRTTLATIPATTPYLAVSAELRQKWRARMGHPDKRRVGIVWSGGFRPDQPELWSVNSRRNIPLAKLAPLSCPDVEFFSLQKGEPAEAELAALVAAGWSGPRLTDFTRDLGDFADTAALIEQLDLVIAVDTSTAHLAGALGKPVWLLNRFDTCWRWLTNRCDSPWYPTLTIFGQTTPGNWDDVVARVRRDLTFNPV